MWAQKLMGSNVTIKNQENQNHEFGKPRGTKLQLSKKIIILY